MKSPTPREADIQRSITDWLSAKGIFWKRMALGGVMQAGGAFRTKNPMTGFGDLWGFLPGTKRGEIFVIECKKPKTGRLSDQQKDWRVTYCRFGVLYILATSLDDVTQAFEVRFG
jgi:hypothetical protein